MEESDYGDGDGGGDGEEVNVVDLGRDVVGVWVVKKVRLWERRLNRIQTLIELGFSTIPYPFETSLSYLTLNNL